MRPRTLDHVALWVADRDRIADFVTAGIGMHVIDRSEKFTLVGSHARHGKLTLFAAEGPREQGHLRHVALRVSSLDDALAALPAGAEVDRPRDGEAYFDVAEGLRLGLVAAPTEIEYDLDHVALWSRDPAEAARRRADELGLAPASPGPSAAPRVEVGGAWIEFYEAAVDEPERPLLNHLAVLVDSADEHIAEAESRGLDIADTVDAANTLALFVWGPERVKLEYVEHKSTFSPDLTLTVAGAGMAGLCAAARAVELGADPVVLEKGTRAGGSMLVSSCVVWRYRSFEQFREECPAGDAALQRLVFERLDDGLAWLESLGAPVVTRDTGNPRTSGVRFEPRGLTEALLRAVGDRVRYGEPVGHVAGPLVLATGGFQGNAALVARYVTPEAEGMLLRANPWSAGDGLQVGLELGAALSSGLGEFYGRAMPAPPARVGEERFVELAQLYGRWALPVNDEGESFAPEDGEVSWSEIELVQMLGRQPGARGWYVVDARALGERVRERSVADMIAAAEGAGGTVVRADDAYELAKAMGLRSLPARRPQLVEPPFTAVRVAAGITHTIGGLAVDDRARVLGWDGQPLRGLYACGADVGGISAGGYASGLAAALVLGRVAAESALA